MVHNVDEQRALARAMTYLILMSPGMASNAPLAATSPASVLRQWAQPQKPGGLNNLELPRVAHPVFVASLAATFCAFFPPPGSCGAAAGGTGQRLLAVFLAHYDATSVVTAALSAANRTLLTQVQGFLLGPVAATRF